jgi:hypothetical protein
MGIQGDDPTVVKAGDLDGWDSHLLQDETIETQLAGEPIAYFLTELEAQESKKDPWNHPVSYSRRE